MLSGQQGVKGVSGLSAVRVRAQAQLELAGSEVERAHGRMAALELQRERAAQAAQAPASERDERQRRHAEEALRGELRAQVPNPGEPC